MPTDSVPTCRVQEEIHRDVCYIMQERADHTESANAEMNLEILLGCFKYNCYI